MSKIALWSALLLLGFVGQGACYNLAESYAKTMLASISDEQTKTLLSKINLKDLDANKALGSQVLDLLKKTGKESLIKVEEHVANLTASNRKHMAKADSGSSSSSSQIDPSLKSFQSISNPYFQIQNVSTECQEYIAVFTNQLLAQQNWTYNVLDSLGKIESGILYGNLFFTGDYTECVSTNYFDWSGKYCYLHQPGDNPMFGSIPSTSLKYGICVPSKCSDQDVIGLINFMISLKSLISYQAPITTDNLTCQNAKQPFDAAVIIAIIILSIIGLLVLVGSGYEIYKRYLVKFFKKRAYDNESDYVENLHDKNERTSYDIQRNSRGEAFEKRELAIQIVNTRIVRLDEDGQSPMDRKAAAEKKPKEFILLTIVSKFSAITNSEKIFNLEKNKSQIDCLDGIRFLSMAWVILGHTYYFPLGFFDNPLILYNYIKRPSFLTITNALFAVDSFYVLSGLLTGYLFVRELNKPDGKFSFFFMFKYYFHRFWRLTPPYAIVLMINAVLTPYFGSGPFFFKDGFQYKRCADNWWANLLYINNFFFNPPSKACFGVTWFLATDFQFHIIAPIFLIPFAFNRYVIGLILCFIFILANIITVALIMAAYPGSEGGILSPQFIPIYFDKIYVKPWGRISPYICGVLAGYGIYMYKKLDRQRYSQLLNIPLWILSIGGITLMVFAIYPDFSGKPLGRVEHILYWSFCRLVWGICLSYICFACATANGGFINHILAWRFWKPFSRLTYSAYLTHSIVISFFILNSDQPLHLNDVILAWQFVGHLAISYASAYVVSVCFEIPFIRLEQLIFRK